MTVAIPSTINVAAFEALRREILLPSTMRVLESDESPPEDCRLMFRIIDPKDGDKRIVWDSTNFQEIVDAKEMFDSLIEGGMIPYCVDPTGQRTPEIMTEFDPFAEEVVMTDVEDKPRREVVFAPGRALAGG
jgi:hypothetical protein